jgi:hypothetical protein
MGDDLKVEIECENKHCHWHDKIRHCNAPSVRIIVSRQATDYDNERTECKSAEYF